MEPQTDEKKAKVYMLGDFMKGREKVIEDPYEVGKRKKKLLYISRANNVCKLMMCFALICRRI